MRNEQRRSETRAGILNAATSGFIADGYDRTGVAEICRRAGVSKGAFYYHFESKEAVFLALLETWLSDLEQSLMKVAAEASTIPESLLSMAGMMQGVLQSNNPQISIFMELWTQASRNEQVRRATLAPYHKYQRILENLIRQGMEEGTLKPLDPVSGAQVILSLSSGLFLQAALDPLGADWGKVLQDSIQVLLVGLTRRE